MKKAISLLLIFLILGGCSQRLPEPEVKIVKASEKIGQKNQEITVRHNVQGNSLYIECFVPHVSFSNPKSGEEQGKALIYIDGKLHGEYETAAFIVKDIPKGDHVFTIEIVNRSNQSLGISKEFSATIS